jgi:hypothetical protein
MILSIRPARLLYAFRTLKWARQLRAAPPVDTRSTEEERAQRGIEAVVCRSRHFPFRQGSPTLCLRTLWSQIVSSM